MSCAGTKHFVRDYHLARVQLGIANQEMIGNGWYDPLIEVLSRCV